LLEMVIRPSMTGEELMCAFLRYGITVKSIASVTQNCRDLVIFDTESIPL